MPRMHWSPPQRSGDRNRPTGISATTSGDAAAGPSKQPPRKRDRLRRGADSGRRPADSPVAAVAMGAELLADGRSGKDQQAPGAVAPVGKRAPVRALALLSPWTTSDSSALTSTDSSLRDRAVVSPIAAAELLLGQSGCDTDMTASGVEQPSDPHHDCRGSAATVAADVPCRRRRESYVAETPTADGGPPRGPIDDRLADGP